MSARTHVETWPATDERPEKTFPCRCILGCDHTIDEYEAFYAPLVAVDTSVIVGPEDANA